MAEPPPAAETRLARLKRWATRLKRDVRALAIAARDPRTPLAAKIVAVVVAAYVLSPIDLIPDVIPVLGWLDELILVPIGIALAVRLIPPALLAEFRAAAEAADTKRLGRVGLVIVVGLWVVLAAGLAILAWRSVP